MRLPSREPGRPTCKMVLRQPAFALAAALLAGSPMLFAQQAIPPMPVTGQTAPLAATPVPRQGSPAEVTFKDGLLEVRANNSSLNEILRDVARVTGMQISGGVPEQRVFGTYGPADAGTVLATLLDGTGVNILVRENAQNAPAELVLTPRIGRPSLPSPSAPQYNAEGQAEAAASRVPMRRPQIRPRPMATPPQVRPTPQQPANAMSTNPNNTSNTVSTMPAPKSMSLDALGSPTSTSGSAGNSGASTQGTTTNAGTSVTQTTVTNANGETTTSTTTNTPNGSATTTTQSPNGVKTPEQIYQQLMNMQKQQQGAAGGSTSTTTSGSSTTPK